MEFDKLSNKDIVRPASYIYVDPKDEEDFKKNKEEFDK
jgi:hypothetical protein